MSLEEEQRLHEMIIEQLELAVRGVCDQLGAPVERLFLSLQTWSDNFRGEEILEVVGRHRSVATRATARITLHWRTLHDAGYSTIRWAEECGPQMLDRLLSGARRRVARRQNRRATELSPRAPPDPLPDPRLRVPMPRVPSGPWVPARQVPRVRMIRFKKGGKNARENEGVPNRAEK